MNYKGTVILETINQLYAHYISYWRYETQTYSIGDATTVTGPCCIFQTRLQYSSSWKYIDEMRGAKITFGYIRPSISFFSTIWWYDSTCITSQLCKRIDLLVKLNCVIGWIDETQTYSSADATTVTGPYCTIQTRLQYPSNGRTSIEWEVRRSFFVVSPPS